MRLTRPIALATLLSLSLAGAAETSTRQGNLSVRNEVQHAIDRGLAWFEKNQDTNGFWSTPDHPAITALVLVAFQGEPAGRYKKSEVVERGYEFLVSNAKPDGSIYGKQELLNYNTALSMLALIAAKDPKYEDLILRGRNFLAGLQADFDEPGALDSPFDGGVGYGTKYKHSDMSNTTAALEALYHSRHLLSDSARAEAKELNWDAVLHFIQNCQNLPAYNKQPWASEDAANKGGFVYYPGHSMAGETNLPSGRVALRSYGSISYAGLLSYIYADLKRNDPRVQAVFEWLRSNYTLEENPGMGAQGLFYYFHTMTKALSAYGVDTLQLRDGKTINWRTELALKLINLQQPDGSWINDNGRWWEKDPALVTAYAVIALELIHRGL